MSEITTVQGGGTPNSENSLFWNGGINWFTPTELGKTAYLNDSVRRISRQGLQHSSAKLMPAGTVLMTSRAGVGTMGILKKEGATNQGFQSLIPNNDIPSYFLYSLQPVISKKANQLASGSTFTEISNKNVKRIEILIPNSFNERKKISESLKKMDFLVTVNQHR